MIISEIKIKDLPGFIESETYKKLNPKPITYLRAVSQHNNPEALPDDIALIIAHNQDKLLGFIGLLPRNTNNPKLHIYSNSCWWVHPKYGKGIALPLFFQALKKCSSKMYLTDCPEHTKRILDQTGYFHFYKQQDGTRGILRFYLSDLILKKYKTLHRAKFIFLFLDTILNTILSLRTPLLKRKLDKRLSQFEEISIIDKETKTFIDKHSKKEFITKSTSFFNWIKNYPWITDKPVEIPVEYPFSHQVKKYELKYFKLLDNGKIRAFVAISLRDNLVRLPFLYYEDSFKNELGYFIAWYTLSNKHHSILTFNTDINSIFKKHNIFIYKKKFSKTIGVTKNLLEPLNKNPIFQDGEGDIIFT